MTVTLTVEDLREVDQMQIWLRLEAIDGALVVHEIPRTVNHLSHQPGKPVLAVRGQER